MPFRSLLVGCLVVAGVARAQSPADHIALGDSAYARFKPDEALTHYERVLALPSDTDDTKR